MKSSNSIKTGKGTTLSKCLKSLALFFKSIPTFFLNLISPVKLQTSQIKLNRSHTKAHNTFLTLFVGAGSFLVAFIFGSLLLIPGDSSAEESIATLSNDPALAVAITPENLNLSITPTPSGALSADELNINVNTDNETGYVMSLASANETTDLTDVSTSNSIHSTAATTDNPAVLSANTWGWYPDSLANNPRGSNYQFAAIPSYDDPYALKQTNTATSDSGDNIPVSIAANVDTSLPAGAYSNIITITTITNYVPRPILDVYPTTGWAGDTITLYSNDGFINVTSVTVGGTECTSINLVSQDELQCTLPDKAETNPDSDNGYNITVTASGTELDVHNFTIRYFNPSRTETASVSNTQITNINMDAFTSIDCGSLSVGDIVSLTDERNGQTYRIKKMQDNKCWMVDNLKYLGEGITISNVDSTTGITYNNDSSKYNTVDGTFTQSTANSDKAFYNNPMFASYCYGTSIQSSYTKCGYLYNWYAATAGTGTYATSTEGTNVSGSICPTGWRLPSAYSDGSTATGNGTSYTAADFAVLNASMNAGSLTTGSTTSSYYANWQFTGAWSGVFSGGWSSGFVVQGSNGYYWSSTARSSTNAWGLGFNSSGVNPGSTHGGKYVGFAIRCVMDPPKEEIYVKDVYPTTGWSGNTVKITLNQIPSSGIQSVTIGGTACTSTSVSDNTVSCTLPSKSASTDGYAIDLTANNIEFDSHNFTIRYFNPSRTETIGSSTTSNITMQNFTQSNCNAMTVGQVVSLTDSRNKQTYRVKKMQDNKCWMVDNLKYKGEGITISNVDSTTGITYNNDSSKYNTVDGTFTQSTANSDKAFYNNPMFASYCYGTSIQSSYTKCGYLYNWYAATAGTGTYATSTRGTNVSGSICPTGWRLPSGSSDGSTATGNGTRYTAADFAVLNASMNAGSLTTGSVSDSYYAGWQFTGAWSGVFSGYWVNGFHRQGSYGYYWSSTVYSSAYAVNLLFGSPVVYPGNGNDAKYYGFAVRCVMEEPPAIQDFTVDECQAKASDTNFTVVDKRDGNDYTVRYINGNCWMTQNLRLSGGRTLTSADSNVASSWYFPNTSLTSGDSYTDAYSTISSNTSYGGYYNFCAASAGTNCSSSNSSDTTYDICPKGWRLPTRAEFGTITDTSYISAFSPVRSGFYTGGTFSNAGSNGRWWSAKAYGSSEQYLLYYNGSSLMNDYYYGKLYGYSVRCIRSS